MVAGAGFVNMIFFHFCSPHEHELLRLQMLYKSSLLKSASLNFFFLFSDPGESKNAGDADGEMPDLASDNDDGLVCLSLLKKWR